MRAEVSAAESQPATTDPETSSADQPAGAIAEPAIETATEPTASTAPPTDPAAPKPNEPPQEKWPQILENARTKARAEAEQQFQQQHGHRLKVTDEQLAALQFAESDPVAFFQQLTERITQLKPDAIPALRSHAARVLGMRAQAAAAQETNDDARPEPDYQDATGTPFYSAAQQERVFQWQARQLEQKFAQQIDPLRQDFATRQQRERAAADWQQADQHADQILTELRANPQFTEKQADVLKLMTEKGWDVHRAWSHVLSTDILPSLDTRARSAVVQQLKDKSTAATIRPNDSGSAAESGYSSFADGLRQELARLGAR